MIILVLFGHTNLHDSSHITPKKPSEHTQTNCCPIIIQIPWLLHTVWSGHKPDVIVDAWVVVVVLAVVVVVLAVVDVAIL